MKGMNIEMNKSNYDKQPFVKVSGCDSNAYEGYEGIGKTLSDRLNGRGVLVIDCYPNVRIDEIVNGLSQYLPIKDIIYSDDLALDGEEITQMIKRNLTDDRVFGVMSHHHLNEFFVDEKVLKAQEKVTNWKEDGILLIIGFGAALVTHGNVSIYADLARWELQQRFRSGEMGNWKVSNHNEDFLRRYKRGFFFEWRIADRHKRKLFESMDYLLDTNQKDNPKMITSDAFYTGLDEAASRPFRVVPFFDPGVWGGQWMKSVCDLDNNQDNYAWCFDCVPEENSLLLKYGDILVEMPSINLVFKKPIDLLGNKVYARFGAEFPIRFDFLDTVEGQNLSLQVHPLTEYIQDTFGMHYTQDESYYLLDVKDDACVYLGVKEGVNAQEMMIALEEAQSGNISFEVEKYVNKIEAKKHDHFLIPAGTVHCSGAGSMVLEISATPYIFTFKLWDWDRLGLDGLPRPINIEHGKEVIQFDRDTKWVMNQLVNQVEVVAEGDGWKEERTGLHENEFIETRRHWFSKPVKHSTKGSVNVLNLIEGKEAIVESTDQSFEPFVVHYAETFIIPEKVKEYSIRPYGESIGKEIATIKAYVRV